jgi:hypothetical protein
MATNEELQHLRKLRQVHVERRRALELQLAQFGEGYAPADKVMDLHDANEAIARIDAKLLLPSIPADVQAATGPEANIDVLRLEVKRLGERLNDAIRWMTTELLQNRDESRDWRAQNERNRRLWQRINFGVLCLILVAVVYLVVGR